MQRIIQPNDRHTVLQKRQFDLAGVQTQKPMKVQLSDGTEPDGPDILTHRHMGHPGEHSIALRHSKASADPLHKEEDKLVDQYKELYRLAMEGNLPPARESEMLETIAKLKEIQATRLEEAQGVVGYDDLDDSMIESEDEEMKEYPYDMEGGDEYEEEEADDLDLARHYLSDGEQAPEGFNEQQGSRGGRFYDDEEGGDEQDAGGSSWGRDRQRYEDNVEAQGKRYGEPLDGYGRGGPHGLGEDDSPIEDPNAVEDWEDMEDGQYSDDEDLVDDEDWVYDEEESPNNGWDDDYDENGDEYTDPEEDDSAFDFDDAHEDTMGVPPEALEPEPMDDYEAYGDDPYDDYDRNGGGYDDYPEYYDGLMEALSFNPVAFRSDPEAIQNVARWLDEAGLDNNAAYRELMTEGTISNPGLLQRESERWLGYFNEGRVAGGPQPGDIEGLKFLARVGEALQNEGKGGDRLGDVRPDGSSGPFASGPFNRSMPVQTSSLWGSGVRLRQGIVQKAEPTIPDGHESGGAEWDERYKIATGDSGGKNRDALKGIEDVMDQHGVVPGGDDIEEQEETDSLYPETEASDYKSSNALAWVKGPDRTLTPDQIGKAQLSSLDTHGNVNRVGLGDARPLVVKSVPGQDLSMGKKYVSPGEAAPEGADLQHGPRGGTFYEDGNPDSDADFDYDSEINRLSDLAERHARAGNEDRADSFYREIDHLKRLKSDRDDYAQNPDDYQPQVRRSPYGEELGPPKKRRKSNAGFHPRGERWEALSVGDDLNIDFDKTPHSSNFYSGNDTKISGKQKVKISGMNANGTITVEFPGHPRWGTVDIDGRKWAEENMKPEFSESEPTSRRWDWAKRWRR